MLVHAQAAQGQGPQREDRITHGNVAGIERPLLQHLAPSRRLAERVRCLATGGGIVGQQRLTQVLGLHAGALRQLRQGLALACT
ncbi:hypothetical protein D3C85_1849930 [compost metagenome]